MELIKELPEVFEEFAEQRQKSCHCAQIIFCIFSRDGVSPCSGCRSILYLFPGRDRKSNGSSYGRLMFCIR